MFQLVVIQQIYVLHHSVKYSFVFRPTARLRQHDDGTLQFWFAAGGRFKFGCFLHKYQQDSNRNVTVLFERNLQLFVFIARRKL